MLRRSMICSVFLTAGFLFLQPAAVRAQEKTATPKAPVLPALTVDELKHDIDNVKLELERMRKDLGKEIGEVQSKTGEAQTKIVNHGVDLKALSNRLESIEAQLKKLSTDVELLKKFAAGEASPIVTARYPTGPAPLVTTNRVILENYSDADIYFVLNQRSYLVPANKTAIVKDVPLGSLTYQLVAPTGQVLRSRTTTVTANDTLTLTATRPGL